MKKVLNHFGRLFHKVNLEFISTAYPKKAFMPGMSQKTFETLTSVDYISFMTYDYTVTNYPGPNAPLDWITKTVMEIIPHEKREDIKVTNKIMLGLNFYGMKFEQPSAPSPIVGQQYLDTIKERKRDSLRWSSVHAEHAFTFRQKNLKTSIFYPTLKSINERLEFARKQGLGISIWDLGQGLNYFYDLL